MVRGFVLGVILLASVGVCIIQETSKQTQARYRQNELARREAAMRQRLAELSTEEKAMLSPHRLNRLVRELGLELVNLGSGEPQALAVGRRIPGQVEDEIPDTRAEDVRLAGLGGW